MVLRAEDLKETAARKTEGRDGGVRGWSRGDVRKGDGREMERGWKGEGKEMEGREGGARGWSRGDGRE